MDASTTRMLEAFDKTRPYFTRHAFAIFRDAYQTGLLPLAVEQTFELLPLREYQAIVRPPRTVDDYFAKTGHIFTRRFAWQFCENCREIDRVVGEPRADAFFAGRSVLEWTQILVANTIHSKLMPSSASADEGESGLGGVQGEGIGRRRSIRAAVARRCFQSRDAVVRAVSHVRGVL